MMNKSFLKIFIICLIFSFHIPPDYSQTLKRLTLQDVLELARDQSPYALLAKHRFRGSYWQYRTFKAKYRPSLNLSATLPEYNRIFEKEFDFETQKEYYVEKNTNNSQLQLSLSQNVGLTGGTIFTRTDLRRFDILGGDGSTQYITTPVSIGFSQPINGYNSLRWEKEIEPIRYEEAKKNYVDAVEQVYIRGIGYFFDLALAELNMEIAEINYLNADTLFIIAQGRYNIGTIAEDELLQMELALLNAGTTLNQAGIDLQSAEFQLRSFLGFNESIKLELILPAEIPELEVDVNKAVEQARENNPELLNLERQLLEAAQSVAEARSEKGLNASLFALYGLTQTADEFSGAYKDPLSQQRVSIGIELPIVEWGLGRGRYKMAQSQQEVVRTQVQQSQVDFEQNIFLNVNQFNLQDDQVVIAAKADTIAQKRYDVTKQRFLIGKIDVLDLNVADSEKDVAKRGYITALRNYWTAFYNVRRLTLYDFENNRLLGADFDKLVE
jgi:outer membrane protein TolC